MLNHRLLKDSHHCQRILRQFDWKENSTSRGCNGADLPLRDGLSSLGTLGGRHTRTHGTAHSLAAGLYAEGHPGVPHRELLAVHLGSAFCARN